MGFTDFASLSWIFGQPATKWFMPTSAGFFLFGLFISINFILLGIWWATLIYLAFWMPQSPKPSRFHKFKIQSDRSSFWTKSCVLIKWHLWLIFRYLILEILDLFVFLFGFFFLTWLNCLNIVININISFKIEILTEKLIWYWYWYLKIFWYFISTTWCSCYWCQINIFRKSYTAIK